MSILRFGDTFFALRFLRLLTTPWKKTNAYKYGLIDEKGNKIKEPETPKEKSVYNIFHRLVFNIKKLINKLPLGKTTLASYAAALFLIKEHTGLSDEIISEILEEVTGYKINPDDMIIENYQVASGEYVISGFIYNVTQKEMVECKYAKVTINEDDQYDTMFGIPVYAATHNESNDILLITKREILR